MSELDSRRQRIVEDTLTRLGEIQVANGYRTDAGLALHAGFVPELGGEKGDPDLALALIIGDEEIGHQGMKLAISLPLEIHGLVKGVRVDSWLQVEAMLADIKQAMETEDVDRGGLLRWKLSRRTTQTRPRESGVLMVGAVITYEAPYAEVWGAPEA